MQMLWNLLTIKGFIIIKKKKKKKEKTFIYHTVGTVAFKKKNQIKPNWERLTEGEYKLL